MGSETHEVWTHPTLTPEEWLRDYDQREKQPKPWTEDEWMQDWADAIIARYCRRVSKS